MGLPAVQKSSRAIFGLRRGRAGFGYRTGFRTGTNCGVIAAPNFGLTDDAGFFRGRRRFGIFCRSSHTRNVSSEIITPSLASDCVSSRMEAPVRRSASSTSRYGSSSANRRERGCRPSAINRARAWALPAGVPVAAGAAEVEAAGAIASSLRGLAGAARPSVGNGPADSGLRESCSPADTGRLRCCMSVDYRASSGRAMGALGSGFKRKRLDVGVLPHCFFWIIPREFDARKRMRWLASSILDLDGLSSLSSCHLVVQVAGLRGARC